MTASQCWPSPATSTWWHSKPATIDCLMDSGVTMAVFLDGRLLETEFPAAPEQRERRNRQHDAGHRNHGEAGPWGHVRNAEESVAEAVDHIKERIPTRQRLPERRQRVDRIEH